VNEFESKPKNRISEIMNDCVMGLNVMTGETQQSVTKVASKPRIWLPAGKWRRYLLIASAAIVSWPFVMTMIYAFVPPPITNLQLFRTVTGSDFSRDWVSLEKISPYLVRAVIAAEDQRFCQHHGIDWVEYREAFEDAFDASEGPVRGASTISMQMAKNLFLWEGRGLLGLTRKTLEVPIALWMDLVWSKHRMIEIYLNEVEWAPGVYGAEAAARHHFKKSAAKLSRREAALLAAVLPNPVARNAGKPSKAVKRSADRIMLRSQGLKPYLTCVQP
jgi:monofunctional glycosyltransferase